MKLTPELMLLVKEIIQRHNAAFVVDVFGPSGVAPEMVAELQEAGLLEGHEDLFQTAYSYGQLVAKLQDPNLPTWDLAKVKAELEKNPIPLSPAEEQAVQTAKLNAAQYVHGLGNKIDLDTGKILVEADQELRAELQGKIQTATAEKVATRSTVKDLKSKLGHSMQDWTRNLDRIGITESHNVMQEGVADGFRKQYGEEARVSIIPMPDACKHCKRLHLGPDGAPIIFKLSQLAPAGANVGKKAQDWVPSVGSVHPHCHPPGTLIQTAWGLKPIEDITPGTRVLSARGHWDVVTHAWESEYDGELVVLAGEGWELVATPNHPVLTCSGEWLPAGALDEKSHVVRLERETLPELNLIPPQDPTRLGKRRFFATVLYGLNATGVPVATVYLDGHPYVWKGHVEEEEVKGEPGHGVQADSNQSVVERALRGRFETARLPLNGPSDLSGSFPAAAYLGVGSLGEGQALVRAEAAHAEALRLAGRPWLGTKAAQAEADGPARHAHLTGYSLHRKAVVEVLEEDGFIEFAPVRDLSIFTHHGAAIPCETAPIVSVSRHSYKGRVYNLSVDKGESYVANGVFSHNCQCQIVRIPEGWGYDEDGTMVPGGEFGVQYEGGGEDVEKAMRLEGLHMDALTKAYRLDGELMFQGMDVAIENGAGGLRFWKDHKNQTAGASVMLWPYGYIRKTKGVDGDHVDCFVGPNPLAPKAYVVHQRKRTLEGGFEGYDEDKVMLGFSSAAEAKAAYNCHYDDKGFFGGMTTMSVDDLKVKLAATRSAPKKLTKAEPDFVVPNPDYVEPPAYVRPPLEPDATYTVRRKLVKRAVTIMFKATTPLDIEAIGGTAFAVGGGQFIVPEGSGGGVNIQAELPAKPHNPHDVAGVQAYLQAAQMSRDVVVRRDPQIYVFGGGINNQIYAIADAHKNTKNIITPDETENRAEEHKAEVKRLSFQLRDTPTNRAAPRNPMGQWHPVQRDWAPRYPEGGDEARILDNSPTDTVEDPDG